MSVPDAYKYITAIIKRKMFCQASIVIASTFFRTRNKITLVALVTGLSPKKMYKKRGTTTAPTLFEAVLPCMIKVVPTTASIVAKNCRRLTLGSEGKKK